ncbi:outer membrane beta-barrel family protein [Massilia litorea]|uniref:TonB-dependent receptor n=1 Tax=Massilia litorea TaxID=2769491 RepID=A0A7L9U4W8_9BURK|nr:outer membrane beta-barrel family protein [Massilia litorea]QOL50113.1 TonB-dependent receptor [Massilia litorea]
MPATHRSDLPRLPAKSAIALGALLACVSAVAQQAPAPVSASTPEQAQSAPEAAATVSVTTKRNANRIDRQVYDVKADPASSNDTVADTLNKVPSVAVDPDGNVTLRGKSNVQIYVDGKPSAMMQGDNRAAAINALPAADLESVEVINNPGAQFGNEGGGGPILNLVMRRERTPGGFASVNANLGTEGRANLSSFGSYTTGRMSVQGGVYGRRDKRESTGDTVRERIDPATGAVARSTQASNSDTANDTVGMNASLSYNLGEKDVVAATVMASGTDSDTVSSERFHSTNAAGLVDSDYLRQASRDGRSRNYSLSTRLDHKGDSQGELFKMDLRLSGAKTEGDLRNASDYTVRPVNAQAARTRQDNETSNRIADFTGDYELPGEHGIVKLGYKLARTSSVFDNAYLDIDAATLAERLNTGRSNRFELDETTAALYASYQWRINKDWGVLGGLRAEYTDVDMFQATTNIRAGNHYLDAIPSAFVTYGWSDDTTLRLSYAHRIRRPGAGDLNPFVVYRDEYNVSSGNPALQPSDSDSLEFGIETKLGKVDTNLRLYARRDTDLISERRFFLADNVLLTTKENAGSSNSGGLEFTFGGKLTDKLSVNASGNLGYAEQSVLGSASGDKRSATTLSGRARFGYQYDRNNHFQLMLNAQGKTLLGEGYRQPVRTADFNYRHNLSPALSLVLNVNDLFDSQKMESITETDRLREHSIRRFNGRTYFVGLSYRFGSFGGNGQRPMRGGGGPGMHGAGGGGGGGGPGH